LIVFGVILNLTTSIIYSLDSLLPSSFLYCIIF
jgi:hypothetical protein